MSLDSPAAVVIDNPVIRMHPADNLVVARIDLELRSFRLTPPSGYGGTRGPRERKEQLHGRRP